MARSKARALRLTRRSVDATPNRGPTPTEYVYNKNGALTYDFNRGITNIQYNVLNLPNQITFSGHNTTRYSYDATGMKHRVIHTTVENNVQIKRPQAIVEMEFAGDKGVSTTKSGSTATNSSKEAFLNYSIVDETITDYCNHVIYENGKIRKVLNPEGYTSLSYKDDFIFARPIGLDDEFDMVDLGDKDISVTDGSTGLHLSSGTMTAYNPVYMYHKYYLRDHLGNNRTVLGVTGNSMQVVQSTDFYPFGMPFDDGLAPEIQPYKFGGKELDEMHGLNTYDQGFRQFGAVIPITDTMDPMLEKYYSTSPYAQWGNNPMRFVDPDGRDIRIRYVDEDGKTRTWTFNGTNQDQAPKNQFVSDFLTAYNYNVENGKKAGNGGDKLQEAAKSTDYTIDITKTENNSNRDLVNGFNVIYWNPNEGLETDKGTLSPATVLEHETDHAVGYETNYYKQLEDKRTSDDHFKNKEEKRVITGTEYKTGVANGELQPIRKGREKLDSSYRSHSRGKNTFVPVDSPTSNKKKKI
jgi:RHS repeat-associated protein